MEKFHEQDQRKSFACEKSMLVKNFLHHGCIFVCGKNLFDQGKILAYGTRKNFDLWKNLNFLKIYLINLKKLFHYKKTIGPNLLKMKLYKYANAGVENIKIYISKSRTKT